MYLRNKMKKLILGTLLLALVIAGPIPAMARVDVNVGIVLPPPIVFAAPPELIVLPETYVYVVPNADMDIFFYQGWWWRPWEGRWYRSRYYNSGWAYYRRVPSFYAGIPSGWRNDYRDHRWRGHPWNYERIPQQQVQRNWKGWEKSKYWEKRKTWGVQNLQPRTQLQQPSRVVSPPQSRSQSIKAKPERAPQHPEAASQSRKAVTPQRQEATPPARKVAAPQHQAATPPSREAVKPQRPEAAKPQHQEAAPPSREEAKPQHSQQQQGDHERGEQEKHDRR